MPQNSLRQHFPIGRNSDLLNITLLMNAGWIYCIGAGNAGCRRLQIRGSSFPKSAGSGAVPRDMSFSVCTYQRTLCSPVLTFCHISDRKECKAAAIPVIVDEVASGMWRLGPVSSFMHFVQVANPAYLK